MLVRVHVADMVVPQALYSLTCVQYRSLRFVPSRILVCRPRMVERPRSFGRPSAYNAVVSGLASCGRKHRGGGGRHTRGT